MSWTDKESLNVINQIRKDYEAKYLIETGTFRGQNANYWSHYFDTVFTCEINLEYYIEAYHKRISKLNNVMHALMPSNRFIKLIRPFVESLPTIFYLDAHFYDSTLPIDKRFVIKDELIEMEGMKNCVIIIHDYDNGDENLGHITYDGIPMGWNIVGDLIKKINPNFYYYTNTREGCNITTTEDVYEGKIPEFDKDEDYRDTLNFVWSLPEKTYRGILYCVPFELNLKQYSIIKYKP